MEGFKFHAKEFSMEFFFNSTANDCWILIREMMCTGIYIGRSSDSRLNGKSHKPRWQ